MTIRKILTEPDPFLRQKSKKVDIVDDEIRSLMDDMVQTMYDAPGIGLAAIQIGVPKRVIVIDISKKDEKKNPMYFVNPEILIKSENDATYEEGLLATCIQYEMDHLEGILFIDYLSKLKKSMIIKKLSKQKKTLERIVV